MDSLCNEGKSPRSRDKNLMKALNRIFVVLLTIHVMERVYLSSLKKIESSTMKKEN